MQQHSGEHIVSGIVHAVYGYDNVGFHMGKDAITMDFNGSISKEELKHIFERFIKENILLKIALVLVYLLPRKSLNKIMELFQLNLRFIRVLDLQLNTSNF